MRYISTTLLVLFVSAVGQTIGPYQSLHCDDKDELKAITQDWNVEDPSIITNICVITTNVDKINRKALENFTNLKAVELRGRILAIEDHAFAGFVHLKHIKLNGGVKRIGPNAFYNLARLRTLDIANNKIRKIQLANLPLLRKLNLSHNEITNIYNIIFINLKTVTSIDLSRNQIRAIETGSFNGYPSVSTLNLSGNQIAYIGLYAFLDLFQLVELILSHNNLTTVTDNSLTLLKSLKRLDLSYNLINEIDSFSIRAPITLTSLDLSHNKITSLDPDSLWLRELTEVRLDHNLIKSLPKDFLAYTPKIEYLDLGFNLIEEFYLYDNLEELSHIVLQHNYLKAIELSATTQRSLKILDLSQNNLTELDKSFQHLTNLQTFSLRDNKLKSFPLCIPGNLTNLDISQNDLQEIALDKFCGFKLQGTLRKANLSSNHFISYNLRHTNKSLQESQPYLHDIDLSCNFLNADIVKRIQDFELSHVKFLKIKPQQQDEIEVTGNETTLGDETTMESEGELTTIEIDHYDKQNNTLIGVTSAALAVAVFAVIAAILFIYKRRTRMNTNRNINDAVMLNEIYDDVTSSRFYDYPRSPPVYDIPSPPPIYHYPMFRPRYDEVQPRPIYLTVLPDSPGSQQLDQQDNDAEENIYEEID